MTAAGIVSSPIEARITPRDAPPYTPFAGPSAPTGTLVQAPLGAPFPPALLDVPAAGQALAVLIETPASGRDTEPYATPPGPSTVAAQLVTAPAGGPRLSGGAPAPAPRVGQIMAGVPWFDRFWSLPSEIDSGIVSEPTTTTLSIHNAHHVATEWVGLGTLPAGVTVTGIPTLPKLMQAHETIELTVQVDIAADTDLDDPIDFDTGDDPTAVVSGPTTIVKATVVNLFHARPERPTEEILEFGTDIITNKDGSEQRRSFRKYPRVICRYRYLRTEGVEAQQFEAMLMALQNDRTVTVPMWHEERVLAQNIAVNDNGLFVDDDAFVDWRLLTTTALIAVIDSTGNFEVVKTRAVLDLGDTTHLLTTDFANAWTAGAAVVPVRRAQIDGNVTGQRWPNGLQEFRVEFRVDDNVSDLSGVAVHASFNGRVYFPFPWPLQGQTLAESYDREHQQLDGVTGLVHQESRWPHNRRSYTYTHPADLRQDIWWLRGTLHKLRGRQVAFYIREFSSGLTTTLTLPAGGTTMRIASIDYRLMIYLGTAMAQGRKMFIRVEFKSGLVETREITNAATVVKRFSLEDLTITPAWNSPFPPGTDPSPAGIERIDFIGLFRMASDRVVFTHRHVGRARVSMPVIEVRE